MIVIDKRKTSDFLRPLGTPHKENWSWLASLHSEEIAQAQTSVNRITDWLGPQCR